jgi:hypothetical protein
MSFEQWQFVAAIAAGAVAAVLGALRWRRQLTDKVKELEERLKIQEQIKAKGDQDTPCQSASAKPSQQATLPGQVHLDALGGFHLDPMGVRLDSTGSVLGGCDKSGRA